MTSLQSPPSLASLTQRATSELRRRLGPPWQQLVVRRLALSTLVRHTGNFNSATWLGKPIWQNLQDAWVLQETIVEREVDLVVECGTNRGGSAYFMATIFDLLGYGHVITVDVEKLVDFDHPRVDFLVGSSVDPAVFAQIQSRIRELKPKQLMVVLDSDHSAPHVARELELYCELLAPGGYLQVQDTCIDELSTFRDGRPGPMAALRQFLDRDPRFEVDEERSNRYLLSHSPHGWIRRVR